MSKTTKKSNKKNAANEVADATFAKLAAQVIDAMENNPGSWSKSWVSQAGSGLPINAVTGKPYTGGNVMFLLGTAWANGYATNQWATFKQWREAGYTVIKDEKNTPVVFFKPILVDDGDKVDENGKQAKKQIWLKRYYQAFNRAQVAPLEDAKQKKLHGDPAELPVRPELERIEEAEAFFAKLDLTIVAGQPAYSPVADHIRMPDFNDFESAEAFYATLSHETVHWSGHESRLNRPKHKRWGDLAYAFEELVAELGAVFLSAGVLGLSPEPRPDHAQYLASWIQKLKDDPSAIWTAATKAEQAVTFIVSLTEEKEEATV